MNKIASDRQIFDYSGVFLDLKAEEEYRLANWADFSHQWRVPLTIAGVIYVFGGATDYLTLGLSAQGLISLGARISIFLLILYTAFLTLRVRKALVFELLTLAIEVSLIVHTLWAAVIKDDSLIFHLPPILLFSIIYYVFVPNRLSLTIFVGITAGAGFLAVAFFNYGTSLRGMISFGLLMIAVNLLGIFEVRRLNRLRRLEFQKNNNLEAEIGKRAAVEQALQDSKADLETQVVNRTAEVEFTKERLNDVVEILSDWVWETDADLRITYISDQFFTKYDLDKNQIIGDRHWTMLSKKWIEKNLDTWRAHRNRIRSHQSFSGFECEAIDGSGKAFAFEASGKAVFDGKGKFRGYRGAGTDLTKQRMAERKSRESEKRFKWILDNSPVGIGISRIENGDILYGNSELAKVYGLKPEELVGFQSSKIWRNTEDRAKFLKIFKEKGFVPQQEANAQRVDGTPFGCLVSWHPFFFEGQDCILFWLVDIDDLKQTEKKLIKAKQEAEEANSAKSQFLAQMSHELRTPLNAIIGFSDSIRAETFGSLQSEKYAQYVDHIHQSGLQLLGLIEDILDLSKIESGKMEVYIRPVDLSELLGVVLSQVKKLSEVNDNTLVTNLQKMATPIDTDPGKLMQILLNLLGNACKFTNQGTITLDFELDDSKPNSHLLFRVSDTGCGISPEDINSIFIEFQRGDTLIAHAVEGTGLGLPISNRLANLLGGEISVQSRLGEGSIFTLRLPITPPTQDIIDSAL